MNIGSELQVRRFLDQRPFGGLQRRVILLCLALAMLDGFDVQSIAFVAPVIAQQWGLAIHAFGPVFGAGLVGMSLGALAGGPLADRIGRRPLLIASAFWFGIFSLLTSLAGSALELALLRFATGLGLGATVPNLVALTSEYTPQRLRATIVSATFCGLPLGATLGGLLSAFLITRFGWQSVFYLGGIVPVVLGLVLIRWLPESLGFLVLKARSAEKIRQILAAIDASIDWGAVQSFTLGEPVADGERPSVTRLFQAGQVGSTLLLWAAFFMSLLATYLLINWVPLLFQRVGLTAQAAILASVIMNVGGVVGGVAIGHMIDRMGARRVLIGALAVGALSTAAAGLLGSSPLLLALLVFCVGGCVIGGQMGLYSLAAATYPTALRATGVGWAVGVGRIGSIIGPVLGGALVMAGASVREILLVCACAPLIAAWALLLLRARRATTAPLTGTP